MTGERVWVFGDYSQAEARVVSWAGPVPLLKQWFEQGKDVHLEVCKMIAHITQDNRIALPNRLFATKHWSEYVKEDPERDVSKQTVHANNYGMGKRRYGLITGLPERYAQILQEIYFKLFPEIRTGYQAWIDGCLRRDRTITLPQGWPIKFYDIFGPDLQRSAYSLYAQSTVGLLITKTLVDISTHFARAPHGRTSGRVAPVRRTPTAIRAAGFDTRLQIHDALGISCPNDELSINYVCSALKHYGEQTIFVRGEPLTIPMDFKVGPNWGDAKTYIPTLIPIGDESSPTELDRQLPSLH
jgi:DNA polymerase family A